MTNYNYLENIKADVKEYIDNFYEILEDKEESLKR